MPKNKSFRGKKSLKHRTVKRSILAVERLEDRRVFCLPDQLNFTSGGDHFIRLESIAPDQNGDCTINIAERASTADDRYRINGIIQGQSAGAHALIMQLRRSSDQSILDTINGVSDSINNNNQTFPFQFDAAASVFSEGQTALHVYLERPGFPTTSGINPINNVLQFSINVDATRPTIVALTNISDPRNSPVDRLEVEFSEVISTTSFTRSDLSLTRDGGPNLITNSVNVQLKAGTSKTFEITGLSGLTAVDGRYSLTVNASGVADVAGNAGSGSRSAQWTLDTQPPTFVGDPSLTIGSDSGALDGSTNRNDNLTIEGTVLEAASVELRLVGDSVNGGSVNLVQPSVLVGNRYSTVFNFGSLAGGVLPDGEYLVRAVASDGLNPAVTSAPLTLTIDTRSPRAVDIVDIAPDPRNSPLDTAEVVFDEDINVQSFTVAEVQLTRGTANVPLDTTVTISRVSPGRYRISGLAAFTGADGTYQLTVNGSGVEDASTNPGLGVVSDTWVMKATPPSSGEPPRLDAADGVQVEQTARTNRSDDLTFTGVASAANSVSVTITDGTFTRTLAATLNGDAYTVDFDGIPEGIYQVTTTASDGLNASSTSQPLTLIVDQTLPRVLALSAVAPDPRNVLVSSVAVELSEPVLLSQFNFEDISLTRDGAPVDLDGRVSVSLDAGSRYLVSGLDALTTPDGVYQLTVLGAGLQDLAGNAGEATASDTWEMDTIAPIITVPAKLNALDDSGVSNGDAITNRNDNLRISASVADATSVSIAIRNNSGFADTLVATRVGDVYSAVFDFAAQSGQVLADGSYQVVVTAVDGVNAPTISTEFTLTIDTTAPSKLSLTLLDDAGTSADTDGIVTDNSPTLNIATMEPDATLQFLRDSATVIAFEVNGAAITDLSLNETTANATFRYSATQTDLAGNVSPRSDLEEVIIDSRAPAFADLDTAVAGNQHLRILAADRALPDSNLPLSLTNVQQPTIEFSVSDQQFASLATANIVKLQLFKRNTDASEVLLAENSLTIPASGAGSGANVNAAAVSRTLRVQNSVLSIGDHTVFVRATDSAGNNTNSDDFTFNVFKVGEPTSGAPATPVFTSIYDIQSALNQAIGVADSTAVQPWQMSFDKTTQTVWFSMEKAGAVAQFDPATGKLKIHDFASLLSSVSNTTVQTAYAANSNTIIVNDEVSVNSQLTAEVNGVLQTVGVTAIAQVLAQGPFTATLSRGFTSNLSAGTQISVRNGDNPHGAFFDFNTHLTPRVFVAHRNGGGNNVDRGGGNESDGRLTYIDVGGTNPRVVSFDFEQVKKQILPSGLSVAEVLEANGIHDGFLPAFHAALVDATGNVWVSSPDAHALLEFDFDYAVPGCGLSCNSTNLTIHPIPHELQATFKVGNADVTQEFHPHGFQVVVNDSTLQKWVWSIDVAGSGRIALMQPNRGTGGKDQWITWDLPSEFESVAGTFVQFDDNETPGTPEDDSIVATFPATAGVDGKPSNSEGTKGFVHRFTLLNPQNPSQSGTRVESWTVPKIPGANATTTLAAANQPFVDRSGEIFVVDRFGSVIRFNANDFDDSVPNVFKETTIVAPITHAISAFPVGVLAPTSVTNGSPMLSEYTLDPQLEISDLVTEGFKQDRSSVTGFAQYEVSGLNTNNSLVATRGPGAFRGALNASNVLYG
jgi:hypothetical protein